MPPRLSHKKTRMGCKRCKARKVKCDEKKPICGACSRHNVNCVYPVAPYGDPFSLSQPDAADLQASHILELTLIHEWIAYACYTISTTWAFWKYQAPSIAFEHRHVLDALLALSALHASRAGTRYWAPRDGKMLTNQSGSMSAITTPSTDNPVVEKGWKQANRNTEDYLIPEDPDPKHEMLDVSRKYFARALEGHQRAVATLNTDNYRSCYLSSILVCYYSLFTLSEGSDEPDSLMLDPMKWCRLTRGTVIIIEKWRDEVGERWFAEAGAMYGEPDLSDNEELFRPAHQEPFKYLLSSVRGDDISHEDREAYEHTLSYIGLIYKGIVHGLDSPAAVGRRLIAMPSRVPPRFIDLIEANKPRALAMLAHAFATMKLAEEKYPWFRGIAQRQVPIVCRALPESWIAMVQWPMEMVKENGPSLPRQAAAVV